MQKKAKVLIVDDSLENRLLLNILLEDDYTVMAADSGEACLNLVNLDRPELILLDINMPGLNGYQVCKKLKSNSVFEDIPIIFISGSDGQEERQNGFNAGGDDYITKPIDPKELTTKIDDWLAKKAGTSANH